MLKIFGHPVNRKFNPIFLVIFFAFFLSFWIIRGVEGASGERNPFSLPAGVQKGAISPSKEGGGPAKTGQNPALTFRVTTILVSGRTKVAGINGVLRQKGEEVNGYRIMEIEEKQVTLSRGKEILVLKIDSEVGHSIKQLNSKNKTMGFSK
jgi:hypothetical protein